MIYILLIIWVNICAVVCFGPKLRFNQNKIQFLSLAFICMAIIMACRNDTVGVDTRTYEEYFYLISNTKISQIFSGFYTESMEIGYALFMKICSIFNPSYYFFQTVFSFLICYLYANFIYNQSNNVYVSTIVFLGIGMYTMTFNIARQMLAVAIVANSWVLLNKKKEIKALIVCLLACTIHISAIIFLGAFIVYIFRNNKAVLKIIFVLSILVAINYRTLINFLANNISRFHNYYSNERVIQDAGLIQIVWGIIIIIAIYLLFNREVGAEGKLLSIFASLYVICNVIGGYFNYFERVGLYFIPFIVILFPYFGKCFNKQKLRWIYYCSATLCFSMFFLISVLTSEQYTYSAFFSWI